MEPGLSLAGKLA